MGRKLTSQVPSKHQVQNKEAVLIVLESVTHIDDKWVIDLRDENGYKLGALDGAGREDGPYLLEQAAFLYDVGYGLHLDALGLVDILESIEVASLLVLNDSDLGERRQNQKGE